ncbi:hypothetical protein EI42_05817 [Thermosporothrix hazakensis]|uniref:Dolichyl-phosphate-mannose-protein mannosyltransferase n=1 Tax=Thermosporothrix hazakensis TaxID=644383 RepID=A0A326TWY9_THEHA|nr:hypothetical protein [Thermosporothrix hazakensis]PZW20812.1 hypothetical protein EI42_05817 [Thermosporothrix hazakensis]
MIFSIMGRKRRSLARVAYELKQIPENNVQHGMLRKKIHIDKSQCYFLVLIGVAGLLRLLLIYAHWPTTDSDESVIMLMAQHIAFQGEHPVFFYGQPYMGALEAYIAAPLFRVLGPSTLHARLGLILLFLLFLVAMYMLTTRLFSKGLALLTVSLLALGTPDIFLYQLRAYGRYPDILLLGALIVLFTSLLTTRTFHPRTRHILYTALGVTIGLALWIDQIILPYVGLSLLTILLFRQQDLRHRSWLSLLLGFLVGAAPLLYYNVTAPIDRNSLNVLLDINRSIAAKMEAQHLPAIRKPIGALLIALPAATGLTSSCTAHDFPFFGTTSSAFCVVTHGLWSLGFLCLLGGTCVFTIRACIRAFKHTADKERAALLCNRLILLLGAAAIFVLYLNSASAAVDPAPTSRYLYSMSLATPALLWPLWQGMRTFPRVSTWQRKAIALLAGALLALCTAFFCAGTYRTFADIPRAQQIQQQQTELVQYLLRHHITRLYTEYWTCNKLIFQSQEQVICAVLDESLRPGQDRYTPYLERVKAASNPAYLFPQHSPQAQRFEQEIYAHQKHTFRRELVAGYVLYYPHQE